jgi:hypothetical protein
LRAVRDETHISARQGAAPAVERASGELIPGLGVLDGIEARRRRRRRKEFDMNTFSKLAIASALCVTLAAPASSMAGPKTRNAAVGGVLGAVAGAAISDGDTGATLAGGALGALVGVAIADDGKEHRYYRDRRGRTYYQDHRGHHVYDDYNRRRRHDDRYRHHHR